VKTGQLWKSFVGSKSVAHIPELVREIHDSHHFPNGATIMAFIGYYANGGASGMSRANGATTQFGYDGVQRLDLVTHGLAGTAHDSSWTFARNPAGQLSAQSRDNPGSGPGQADAYAWTGHYAVARPYTTNGLNQYSAAGSASFAYDPNGNLIADGTFEYAYDIENRLVEGGHTPLCPRWSTNRYPSPGFFPGRMGPTWGHEA
jgi:hypothetical protein